MEKKQTVVCLGIDPGFSITGYAVVFQDDQGKILLKESGVYKLPTSQSLSDRIKLFYDRSLELILTHQVTKLSLETSFCSKNPQVFLKLGYLRGILYLLAAQYTLSIVEYAPRTIKMNITGRGNAEKEQVAFLIHTLFPALKASKHLDKTDAIAIALCGLWDKQ